MKVVNKKGTGKKTPAKTLPNKNTSESQVNEPEILTIEQQYMEFLSDITSEWVKTAKGMGHNITPHVVDEITGHAVSYFNNRMIFGIMRKIGIKDLSEVLTQEDKETFNDAVKVSPPATSNMKSVN